MRGGKDNRAGQHLSAVLYDLVAKENARARSIVQHMENESSADAQKILGEIPSPLKLMNQLLRRGNLKVKLAYSDDGTMIAEHEGKGRLMTSHKCQMASVVQ